MKQLLTDKAKEKFTEILNKITKDCKPMSNISACEMYKHKIYCKCDLTTSNYELETGLILCCKCDLEIN